MTDFFSSPSVIAADLVAQMTALNTKCKDPSLLAPFSENYNRPRFASYTNDTSVSTYQILMM